MPDIAPSLLTWDTATQRLNISERHLRRLVYEHRIPHIKVGGLVRFDAAALEEWLESRTIRPATSERRAA